MSKIKPAYFNLETSRCELCPHLCALKKGSFGLCRVRGLDMEGNPHLPFYGAISALAVDPIEKKPLFHYFPGSAILSIGFLSCNARCPFCQNYRISQSTAEPSRYIPPEDLPLLAKKYNSFGIAYTYSEPLIHFEYIHTAMTACREKEIKNILISNAHINREAGKEIFSLTDAANFDLKCFIPEISKKKLGIDLKTVKENIKLAHSLGVHIEISTLIVPDINDDAEQIIAMAKWLAKLSPDIPWHLSAYHPAWKYTAPATKPELLYSLKELASPYLKNIYLGNI